MTKCKRCSKPATLHITEIRSGAVQELHLVRELRSAVSQPGAGRERRTDGGDRAERGRVATRNSTISSVQTAALHFVSSAVRGASAARTITSRSPRSSSPCWRTSTAKLSIRESFPSGRRTPASCNIGSSNCVASCERRSTKKNTKQQLEFAMRSNLLRRTSSRNPAAEIARQAGNGLASRGRWRRGHNRKIDCAPKGCEHGLRTQRGVKEFGSGY